VTAHSARSYDAIPDFGRLYDSVPVYQSRADVPFYVDEAVAAGGPVLEIGCGTGRVLLPTARATGRPVVGLDGSQRMLERCAEKLAAEEEPVRRRVELHAGDACRFELGRSFALITAPFRVLQQLTTIDEQLACLASVARHLGPDGRFVFDVFNPSLTALTSDRSVEHEDTPPIPLTDGRTLSRSFRVPRVRWIEQVIEAELIYYVTETDGVTHRHVQAFDMRWFHRAELEHLLVRAGFTVDVVYGDFSRGPLTDAAPDLVVVCHRRD
jgi:SAM-dependent methyltransferase